MPVFGRMTEVEPHILRRVDWLIPVLYFSEKADCNMRKKIEFSGSRTKYQEFIHLRPSCATGLTPPISV